jgi:MFS family permease
VVTIKLNGNLWNHRDFSRLWISETISQFGNKFSGFAIPVLAVLTFDATPFQIGVIVALSTVPYTALGLFVGVWADRFRRRRIMIICNISRVLILGSIPASFFLGTLDLLQFFVVSLANGIFSVFFDVSYQAYLPILVDRRNIMEGNQKLQLSASAAQVVGPGVAGVIYQVLGGALTVGADSIGYLVSAIVLISIKKEEPKINRKDLPQKPDFFREMKEGIDVVLRNPILSTIAACAATGNLGTSMVAAVYSIFALDYLHFSVIELGLVGTVGAVGLAVGAILSDRIPARFGLGVSLAMTTSVAGTAALIPLAQLGLPVLVMSVAGFTMSFSSTAFNTNQVTLRQAITPDRLQGRMNATMRTIVWATVPVGAILGGSLGGSIGIVDTLYLGGLACAVSGLWIVFGPAIKLRKQPMLIE